MESISLSPLGLFLQAGPVGKGVMVLLLVMSVWCWLLIAEGIFSVIKLSSIIARTRKGEPMKATAPLLDSGRIAASLDLPGESVGDRRIRVQEAISRAGRDLLHKAEGGMPNLAVIASVAPFIGLFGTVWGIMTSFVGIAHTKDTSLAVVAPGIAEALAATAYGLAAAIPATIGYNRISASLGQSAQKLSNLIEEQAVDVIRAPRPNAAFKGAA